MTSFGPSARPSSELYKVQNFTKKKSDGGLLTGLKYNLREV
jgi:hypothetical protein